MKKTLLLKLLTLLCFSVAQAQDAEVQNSIEFTTTPVAQSDVNDSHILYYRYTLAQPAIVKLSLSKYHRSGIPMQAIAQFIINPALPTTDVHVESTAELFIPQGTILSSQLINGQYYQWDAMLMTDSAILASVVSPVTIGNSLGINSFDKKKNVIHPNPVSENLFLSHDKNVPYWIIDETGRVVLFATNTGSIDVSALNRGVYFLRIDEEILKFIKH